MALPWIIGAAVAAVATAVALSDDDEKKSTSISDNEEEVKREAKRQRKKQIKKEKKKEKKQKREQLKNEAETLGKEYLTIIADSLDKVATLDKEKTVFITPIDDINRQKNKTKHTTLSAMLGGLEEPSKLAEKDPKRTDASSSSERNNWLKNIPQHLDKSAFKKLTTYYDTDVTINQSVKELSKSIDDDIKRLSELNEQKERLINLQQTLAEKTK